RTAALTSKRAPRPRSRGRRGTLRRGFPRERRDEPGSACGRAARRSADTPRPGALDRLQDHRDPRVRAHHPHLGPDHRSAGDDGDALLRDLRQPDRTARRGDGRLRLPPVHCAGTHHDGADHQLLRQRGVVVLRRQVRLARGGVAGVAAPELGDRGRLRHRRYGARAPGGSGGDDSVAPLHPSARAAPGGDPAAVLLTSLSFALGGFLNALFAKNFDQVNWIPTFVLTPLTYFGGVFYSIALLPPWAQRLSFV